MICQMYVRSMENIKILLKQIEKKILGWVEFKIHKNNYKSVENSI